MEEFEVGLATLVGEREEAEFGEEGALVGVEEFEEGGFVAGVGLVSEFEELMGALNAFELVGMAGLVKGVGLGEEGLGLGPVLEAQASGRGFVFVASGLEEILLTLVALKDGQVDGDAGDVAEVVLASGESGGEFEVGDPGELGGAVAQVEGGDAVGEAAKIGVFVEVMVEGVGGAGSGGEEIAAGAEVVGGQVNERGELGLVAVLASGDGEEVGAEIGVE